MAAEDSRTLTITEHAAVTRDGLLFGYGPMLPFPAAALVLWFGEGRFAAVASHLIILWGAAILLFLSGVRRGLSFRTEGGPRPAQFAAMLWLFLIGLGALLAPPAWAAGLLLAGYGSILLLEPRAARRGEVPLYFARLRPWQMAVPTASLALTWAALL